MAIKRKNKLPLLSFWWSLTLVSACQGQEPQQINRRNLSDRATTTQPDGSSNGEQDNLATGGQVGTPSPNNPAPLDTGSNDNTQPTDGDSIQPDCDALEASHFSTTKPTTCASDATLCSTKPLRLAKIFGDSMVLQRGEPRVWGWGYPFEFIRVKFGTIEACGAADEQGRWQVKLLAIKAGGPFSFIVEGDKARPSLSLKDVLAGDVWLASGQSNMNYGLNGTTTGPTDYQTANIPTIRFMTVNSDRPTDNNQPVPAPQAEIVSRSGSNNWNIVAQEQPHRGELEKLSAVAFYFGRALQARTQVPIGLVAAAVDGSALASWWLGEQDQNAGRNFNFMIHPLLSLSIKGIIWYQGESDLIYGREATYHDRFVGLINSWRQGFGLGELPFYYVQVATLEYHINDPYKLPLFWQAQAKALTTPHTGMVVITDVSEYLDKVNGIHPPNKKPVGERLANIALYHDYGQKEVLYSGPVAKDITTNGSELSIRFDFAGTGLATRNSSQPWYPYFELAGEDGNFQPATMGKIEGEQVTVSAAQVPQPRKVRYAWTINVDRHQPPLVNSAQLPASSFELPAN